MRLLGGLMLAALALLAVFAAANWSALTVPTELSFVFFRVEAPLGVVLLAFALAFALLLLAGLALQRTAMLVESRRHAQEARALRELAENAEASRLAELRRQIEESTNTLAAHLGQLDDKLDRLQQPR